MVDKHTERSDALIHLAPDNNGKQNGAERPHRINSCTAFGHFVSDTHQGRIATHIY